MSQKQCYAFNSDGVSHKLLSCATGVVTQQTSTEISDMFRSIGNKHAKMEMNKNLHENSFTNDSNSGNEVLKGKSLETEGNRYAALPDAPVPSLSPSQDVDSQTKCGDTANFNPDGPVPLSTAPSLDQHYQTDSGNVRSSSVEDSVPPASVVTTQSADKQSPISKACILHSDGVYSSNHYLSSLPKKTCLVVKTVEIDSVVYGKLEPHIPR